jgi:uncharacterized protein GlcG (DUF336 family)
MTLTLEIAEKVSSAVISTCKSLGFAPITVIITDAAGIPIVSKRMDGCSPVGIPQFAQAKATTCVAMKMSSRMFRDKYTKTSDPAKHYQMLSMVLL